MKKEIEVEELDEDYDEAYPENKVSQKAKGRYSPYKTGGKYRSRNSFKHLNKS
jgi:hypothetical protein